MINGVSFSDSTVAMLRMFELSTITRGRYGQENNPSAVEEEFLLPGNVTQTEFAGRLGWTRARLNELIKGKRGITAEAALDLAEALGTSPRLWMNLQATFDLAAAEKKRAA